MSARPYGVMYYRDKISTYRSGKPVGYYLGSTRYATAAAAQKQVDYHNQFNPTKPGYVVLRVQDAESLIGVGCPDCGHFIGIAGSGDGMRLVEHPDRAGVGFCPASECVVIDSTYLNPDRRVR
jgi:hypothetical protein